MIFCMYSLVVDTFAQWLGECVSYQSLGQFTLVRQADVVP